MKKTFICQHCHKYFAKNPRLKGTQLYCGSRECQRARKNKWSREQYRNNADYKSRRQQSRKKWYDSRPGYQYQRDYRKNHSNYIDNNSKQQLLRNQKRIEEPYSAKIVNTDALNTKSVARQDLYVLIPYKKADAKKIVNTDALIVQMVDASGLGGNYSVNSS